MTRPYILVSMNTPLDTTDWLFGKRFLEILTTQGAMFIPELIGNYESCNEQFISVESCESVWESTAEIRAYGSLNEFNEDFFWKKRSSIKCLGHVMHTTRVGPRSKLKLGSITIKYQVNKKTDWYKFMIDLCSHVEPTYGMMHLFTAPELTRDQLNNDFQIGISSKRLERGIPELACFNFFNNELANTVDIDEIRMKGGIVEKVGDGYFVSINEDLFEVDKNYLGFSQKREVLKSAFEKGVFLGRE